MLDEAYTEISHQPAKKKFIGKPDTVILPNEFIQEYISGVYEEYNIPDPVEVRKETLFRSKSSHADLKQRLFETPKKQPSFLKIEENGKRHWYLA